MHPPVELEESGPIEEEGSQPEETTSMGSFEEPSSLPVILRSNGLEASGTASPMEQRTESQTFMEEASGSDDDEIDIELQDNLLQDNSKNDIRIKLKSVLSHEMNGIEFKRRNKQKLVREMLKNHSVLYQR